MVNDTLTSNWFMQKKKQDNLILRGRLTKQQAYPIIERYFRSGLMPCDFYRQEGWSDNQFYSWRKRYMEEHNMLTEEEFEATNFHPIEISQPNNRPSSKTEEEKLTIKITYPNGVTLRVYSRNTTQLVDLIKLY